jgi:hypothetical protein
MTAFAVTWFDRPPDRPVEGTVFVVPADVVHQCTYLAAVRTARRWQCDCGQVWERTTVPAAGRAWPAWQRVEQTQMPIPGDCDRRRAANPPEVG